MSSRPKTELYGVLAEFDTPGSLLKAAEKVRDAGYTRWDVFSPFPIHGAERAMGVRSTRLPWLVLCCGLTGAALALFFQWWTNAVDYPFKISGKPYFGIPANVPVTFEFTVLLSAFGAFFGMLLFNRLPRHNHALFESERFRRVTDNGFFLAIEAADVQFSEAKTTELLRSVGGRGVEVCHEGAGSARLPGVLRGLGALVVIAALVPLALIVKGRFVPSTDTRLHLVSDMDSQARFRAQAENPFFADGRAMRPDVEGTVAFGELQEDERLHLGKDGEAWVEEVPMDLDHALLERGRERFDIYCTACHGYAGYGDGRVAVRAQELQEQNWVPPTSLHTDIVRSRPVGQLFDTIRNGVRTMPAYRSQVSVEDSWAIVAYVRALQRSQAASTQDVPASERASLGLD